VTPKLLLADDSVTIQRVIELTFADEDVQVLAVGDGQQAIDRVRADRPDIVLADVGMPERDGYEVAAFIKSDPQFAHIPVLLLTGAFEPVDEVRARAVGCDGVLVKPFEPQMVISRVRDLLAGNRGADSFAHGPAAAAAPRPSPVPDSAPAEGAGGSLEDYFDRLDAALASKTGTPPPAEPVLTPAPPRPAAAEPPRIKVSQAAPEPPSSHVFSQFGPVPDQPAPAPPAPPPPSPPVAPKAVAPAPPAAVDPPVVAPPPKAAPASQPEPLQEPSLQEAFAALLAAEQAQAPAPPASRTETPSSELVDEVARRVIARMGDESMRAAVLDAAERLVREEIARIKAQN
jgi:CheY-like chemotaxis protein